MAKQLENSFLGIGWSFPPTFEKGDFSLKVSGGEENIIEGIDLVLSTNMGSNPVNPEFGSMLSEFMFREMTTTLQGEIEREVKRVLLDYEPRIKVEDVVVNYDDQIEGKVNVIIVYMVIQNNTRHNHVYPFYIKEGTNL
jgi:hypothetical protein